MCFVGYSINDPVLRYMMDALAADRMFGEQMPQAYAFGDYSGGNEEQKRLEWQAKGVFPILYEVQEASGNHSALHKTLKSWAEVYRDGVIGKERVVVQHSMTLPLASTKQDDFVGRLLWALSDDSGFPAKRFAEHEPVPALDWLEPLCDKRYGHLDLPRFGIIPHQKEDKDVVFSLAARPSPYTHAPWMTLVSYTIPGCKLDAVLFQIARWLIRRLDDPMLLLWVAKHGTMLHDQFSSMIQLRLDELAHLERSSNKEEMERIRSGAPMSIPRPLMRTLWRLALAGKFQTPGHDFKFSRWKEALKAEGLTPSIRLQMRELLSPRISIRQAFRWREEAGASDNENIKAKIRWELVLSADHVKSEMDGLSDIEEWRKGLPSLIGEFHRLLRDALDLMRELGDVNDHSDRSNWDLPSISPHWQNRGHHDWVVLIELLRDSWVAIWEQDREHANSIAISWIQEPYAAFKRLSLFAANYEGISQNNNWVDWLLCNGSWWLWSIETQREALRLLVNHSSSLPSSVYRRLEKAILLGPPRHMFRDDISEEDWISIIEHTVWLRLAKIVSGGTKLNKSAERRLQKISAANPHWKLAADERDEFSHWMSGTGDPDFDNNRIVERAPLRKLMLLEWLKKPTAKGPLYEDDWREVCQQRYSTAAWALRSLAKQDQWPVQRWSTALQVWSDEKLVSRSWAHLAPFFLRAPEEKLLEISGSLTWWMESASKKSIENEDVFFAICDKVISIKFPEVYSSNQYVTRSINHPVGQVTQALINFLLATKPNDNQLLSQKLNDIFSMLSCTEEERYRVARVIMCANVIALFRIDRQWTVDNIIPLFDWRRSFEEARAAWEGFLWSARLYRPLMLEIKGFFLDTSIHYNQLQEHREQYAVMLTYASLEKSDIFSIKELHDAVSNMGSSGLELVAQSLLRALESAEEKREVYWENRIFPFWKEVWPKFRDIISSRVVENLAKINIAARDAFPKSVEATKDWLIPLERPDYIIHLLHDSQLGVRFPEKTLDFLNAIVGNPVWVPRELMKCLEQIATGLPSLQQDHRYVRLKECSLRRG